MSELAVRTRTNAQAQGKPRVYFSCIKEDFERYFEVLCGEIFTLQNCAVYYESQWEVPADWEALQGQLAQMQLFVLPVSRRLLEGRSRALELEYGFAMEKHIPVLPVLMEPGLGALFSERMDRIGPDFGKLQYIDRTSADSSEIPYAEKLKKRLEAVLTDDETAARVRSAFDACIFLSYRKKDRIYAQELMRMIHRIPYCRDIAVWYDEFLVPGEAWDEAIAEAMGRSRLIALAVTPGFTEPGNYIVRHEYPAALDSGKTIVPAVMQEPDPEALRQLFPGIPELIDGRNAEELSRALQELEVRKEDGTPEHRFLIGLAYLGAIDMERDPEMAVRLITSAAEDGLEEAVRKLIEMYWNGDGVERDCDTAVKWQEVLVRGKRKRFEDGEKHADGQELWKCLTELADRYHAMDRQEKTLWANREALNVGLKMRNRYGDKISRSMCSASYNNIGLVCRNMGAWEDARRNYEKALKLNEEAMKEGILPEELADMSLTCEFLGEAERLRGNLQDAEKYFERSLQINEHMVMLQGTLAAKQNLCVSYAKIGDCRRDCGNLQEAEELYLRSLRLRELLLAEQPSLQAKRDLCLIYFRLGDLKKAQRQPEDALACYRKLHSLCRELTEEAPLPELKRLFGLASLRLGKLEVGQGNAEDGERYVQQAFALGQQAVAEMRNTESLQLLHDAAAVMGNLRNRAKRPEDAERYYQMALEAGKERISGQSTLDERKSLAEDAEALGDLKWNLGKPEEAAGCYKLMLELRDRIVGETENLQDMLELCVSCSKCGNTARELQDWRQARDYYEASMRISEDILKRSQQRPEARRNMGVSLSRLGEAEYHLGRPDQAAYCYREALNINRRLVEENRTADALINLSLDYERFGDLERDYGSRDKAGQFYQKTLELRRELAAMQRDLHSFTDLAEILERLGSLELSRENRSAAGFFYRELLNVCEELASHTKTVGKYMRLAECCYCLWRTDIPGGREYLLRAWQICRDLQKALPDDPVIRRQADDMEAYLKQFYGEFN